MRVRSQEPFRLRKRAYFTHRLHLFALLLCCTACASAFAYDEVFANGFEETDAQIGEAEAARFLTMATFGPTASEIANLRALGYRNWIAQQLAMPTTLERPYVECRVGQPNDQCSGGTAQDPNPGQNDRLQIWMKNSLNAPDQLRQRMAWALSQIMVVTYGQSMLAGDPVALAEYYDTLARDSSGSYADLLHDVTLSPAMAKMLTYLRNKSEASSGTAPDENYAREVLQLFSIGLVMRNRDFTPIYPVCTGSQCDPIPTYTQDTVQAFARVFTGWSYQSGFNSNPTRSHWTTADYLPLTCYTAFHDDDAKTLLSYTGNYTDGSAITLPANNGCANDLFDTRSGHSGALQIIAHHPNVAPFISRQLIQRFTSSNPSPDYIRRVANVFVDDGSGAYGNLGSVIAAVLLDPEARYGAAPATPPFGKAREPLLRLTAFYRYYNAAAASGLYKMTPTNFGPYLQTPMGGPSVFNFYLPDYLPPGPAGDAGLFAPELQIINESSAIGTANDLARRAGAWLGNPNNGNDTIAVDLSSLEALAGTPASLVQRINHDLMYGSMSSVMKATLTTMLQGIPYSANDPHTRVNAALDVVLASPEFAIQK